MAVTSVALPNNLVTAADSDFEAGAGAPTWAANVNAGVPAVVSTWAFAGSQSLQWSATTSGNTSIITGAYAAVTAGLPYIASLIIKPGAARSCLIGIAWYNGASFLSSSLGAAVSVGTAGGPVTIATVAPATATMAAVIAQVNGAGAGEAEQIDFVYVAQSDTQVLIDWPNVAMTPNSVAGSAFSDISPFVRMDTGVAISRGRQDAVGEVQPGSATFSLYNTAGWFTSHSTMSPWYPNVTLGRRVQVNMADELGNWHVRADMALSGIDYTLTQNGDSYANITCSDVLANLSRQAELSCWTRQAVLAGAPVLHWTLNDDTGSGLAAESSGNNGPPLRPRKYGTGASFSFGAGSGGVEIMADAPNSSTPGPFAPPLPSAYFTTVQNAFTSNAWTVYPSYQMSAAIAPLSTAAASSFTLECWVMLDPAHYSLYTAVGGSSFNFTALSLADTRSGNNVALGYAGGWFIDGQASPPSAQGSNGFQPAAIGPQLAYSAGVSGNPPTPAGGIPVHVALAVSGASGGATSVLYVNGQALTGTGLATWIKGFSPNWIDVGGAFGGWGGWLGNISLVSIYGYAFSAAQALANYNMGWHGMYKASPGAAIQQLATFASVPSFWQNLSGNGLAQLDYYDVTGQNALAAMQQAEQAELAGLLYAPASGRLTFDGRNVRMGATTPVLTLPAGAYDSATGHKVSDQYLATQATVGTLATARAATVINPAAQNAYGTYAQGTPQSPNQLPLQTIAPEFRAQGVPAGAVQLEPYVQDAAAWQAFRLGTPPLKAATVTVDVLSMTPASPAYVALSAVYGVDINSLITMASAATALPTEPGSLDCFIEGVTELRTETSHTVGFYTSPANLQRCWKPGDAVYGVLDSTAVIGVSATDAHAIGPNAKLVASDPGAPFWPPAYAATMNNGGISGLGFVGATDQRGIFETLQAAMNPPLCVVGQTNLAQNNINSGPSGIMAVAWDQTYQDTRGGMSLVPGWPNWYVVLLPGEYELDATVVWATGSAISSRFAEFLVAPTGAANGSPLTGSFLNVAGTVRRANTGQDPGVTLSTRLYCGIGTMIGLRVWQDSGASLNMGLIESGSLMSITWRGFSVTAG